MTKNIYSILNILVIGVIIYTGVDTFYRIFEAKLAQPHFENSEVIPQKSEAKRSRTLRLKDYEIINRRSIFGKTAEASSGPAEELPLLDNLEPTSLNISLIATFVVYQRYSVVDQELSVAVISVKSKRPPQDTYHVGDSVEGALIKSILRNKVILNINGKDQILVRDEESTPTASSSMPPARESEPRPSSSPLSRAIPLKREDIEAAFADLPNLSTQVSVTQHFTEGEPDGLAITGIKSGSIFSKMGLRNGDIIKSVQDKEIKGSEELISLYNDLQSEESVSIQYIRRGQERTNVLNLK